LTAVQTALEVLALTAAIAVLVPAFFVTWWLAGSDDEARNPVAPLIGIAVLGTSVWSIVVAARMQVGDSLPSLLVMAAPAVLLLLAAPFAGNRAHGRAPLKETLPAVGLLSIPALFGGAAVLVG
jgi:hypothetical protein